MASERSDRPGGLARPAALDAGGRLAAVAQAIANVRHPIATDPIAEEIDFKEARRFLAALDTARRFASPPPPLEWPPDQKTIDMMGLPALKVPLRNPLNPPDPDALLTRRVAAAALSQAGFPTALSTLARKASVGGGPVYRRYGPRVVYRWGDLLVWAQARLGAPMRSTSETDAAASRDGMGSVLV